MDRRHFLQTTALGVLAAGCSTVDPDERDPGGGVLDRVRRRGHINVGFANESPYCYTDRSGNLVGAAADLAKTIFSKLGVAEVRGVQLEFGALIGGLLARRYDAIAAGMFINPERCALVAFADPDYCAKTAFLVPKGNPDGVRTFEDVADNDLRLGVLTGAIEASQATAAGVRKGRILTFANQPSAFEGLKADSVDALTLTRISLVDLLRKNADAPFEVTEPFSPKGAVNCGAFAFRKEDTDLLRAWNAELTTLKRSRRLLKINQPYGFTEAELPGTHQSQEFC